jgi:hypothetical protein
MMDRFRDGKLREKQDEGLDRFIRMWGLAARGAGLKAAVRGAHWRLRYCYDQRGPFETNVGTQIPWVRPDALEFARFMVGPTWDK